MADITSIFSQFPNAAVNVAVGEPPNYDRGRVIVRGNPAGFRLLAGVLSAMANEVGVAGHAASAHGWQLGLSPDDLRWLKMDNSVLVLDCSP